jgi:hypothetical protein
MVKRWMCENPRIGFRFICILVAAGLALGAAVEHRTRVRQTEDNRALRQKLSQMDRLLAENQRLSNLVAQGDKAPAGELPETETGSNEQSGELVRLRNEVGALQQQYQELQKLRADTRHVRADNDNKRRNAGQVANTGNASDTPDFEILSANYWTANTNMDVAAELQDRVRGSRLKAVASNNIKGDPDFGQVKHLTVVYRVGGVIRTNEFREGDVVILPQEQNGSE